MSEEGNTSLPKETDVKNGLHNCKNSQKSSKHNPTDPTLDNSINHFEKSQTAQQPDLPNINNLSIESTPKESSTTYGTSTANGTLESPQPIADNQSSQGTEPACNRNESLALDYQKIVERLHNLGNEIDEGSPLLPSNRGMTNGVIPTPPSSPCPKENTSKEAVLVTTDEHGINYCRYQSEHQMPDIMSLISKDLSEPYSIYTYRYFIHNWPNLCFLAVDGTVTVGAVVCKLDPHKRTMRKRGYLAMLAVDNTYRRKKIGSKLVSIAINAMIEQRADEIVLETEVTNASALRLYEKLGFVRDKRLHKYYLNGVDAFRLKLWLT